MHPPLNETGQLKNNLLMLLIVLQGLQFNTRQVVDDTPNGKYFLLLLLIDNKKSFAVTPFIVAQWLCWIIWI